MTTRVIIENRGAHSVYVNRFPTDTKGPEKFDYTQQGVWVHPAEMKEFEVYANIALTVTEHEQKP